ncbi:uncharacterized protein LOC124276799 isoform X2 [Haliotis rubra]|uniref:uncharacterized protein LOC124276799 isoform X2 n=1 Tax=Haliotis rubra TaxID=36100 RepID=UPI001EE4EB94|nr:uncharacterized protein LOC124276799 isoform X2 [Haliotis rubra]
MNDTTESSTTCNTTNTTDILEEHYTRTDQPIPGNVSQDSSGIRYAMLESDTQIHTEQDILEDKMDEAPATGIKSNDPVSHEGSLGYEEVDKDHSQEDGTSPVGTLRPLSVLGLPQKDLSNRRLSLESRGSSEFILEADEVPIVSSRGDEILPETTVSELPTDDNLPESQTFINGYLRLKPTVVEHRGDEGEESYCSLAVQSARPEQTEDTNTTQKGQGDDKVINSPSCTHPSPLESKLADYLGNVNMNSLIAVVGESPVDVDYIKTGKSKETSYHLVLNEEHCEPDSGSLGDDNVKDSKAPDDKDSSGSGIKSLEDKSELSVVKNIPTVSVDPELQEINRTQGMTHLKEQPTGKRKAVTFVDGHLPQKDIHASDLSPEEISNAAETQGSNEERLTNKAMLKSEVMKPEVILHQGTDNQEDLKPHKSVQEETSLPAATLQANINHVTETVPDKGMSEDTTATSPNNVPTSETNLMPGHHRQSTSLHGQTVMTVAEVPRGLSEKVDEPVPTSETNTDHGHPRHSTSLHGQTVITVAEAPRGLSEKVKEPEDKTATNPLRGNHTLSTSLPGTTVLTVAEAGQVSVAAAIVQSSNEAVDGQVEQRSEHRVVAVSECEGLPDKAPHKHVTQGEEQNRMSPPRNEEQKEEVEPEQVLGDTENTDARDSNDQLSDEASAPKPATVSDSVSSVHESDASGLNGDAACGRQQTIASKPSGMSVTGNMAESDGQSVSESKRGLHSDQTSGHRIILVSESLPAPVAKAKVIERRPGGSRVILVSEKSEV